MNKLLGYIQTQAGGGTMKRKLFLYMLLLLFFILLVLASMLSLMGQFKTPKDSLLETCELQQTVFQKNIQTHRNHLSMMGIHFSEDLSSGIESWLSAQHTDFSSLSDSHKKVESLEDFLFDTVRQYLMQADCSGAFFMLDTTVNTSAPNAAASKSGLYLQVNGYEIDHREALCYRGSSEVAKQHGVMPHRKWKLELDSNIFWGYALAAQKASLPLDSACSFTDFITLPGMSERAMHIAIPITGADGTFYGVCGFEVSESYFKQIFAQPTKLSHMLAVLSNSYNSDKAVLTDFFSCGTTNGYYYLPKENLFVTDFSKGLSRFSDGTDSYIGVLSTCEDVHGNSFFTTAIMIPEKDFTAYSLHNLLRLGILLFLLVVLSVVGCIYFSHRFLVPLLRSLEQIQKGNFQSPRINMVEIDDLLDFLAQKDGETEKEIKQLQEEINHLIQTQNREINEEEYRHFQTCLASLTGKELDIFKLYLEGKTSRQIQEICAITSNTLKYHNANIYSKLGIKSRKELLTYATMMKEGKREDEARL